MNETIRELEHISLRAWASLKTHHYDGWILRYANGYTGRANSVQPLDASILPVAEKIDYCEAWYAECDLPCIFRLTDAMQPQHLDAVLETRAYERYNETQVQVANLADQSFQTDSRWHFQNTVTDDWLSAWGNWNAVPEQHIATAKQMLSQTNSNQCFAWIDDIAVGLAVQEKDHIGLFDIVVHPDYRRQGLGFALVSSLLTWGKTQFATTAYLQVVGVNAPAIALYDKLGFKQHHHYWYRRQQQ